MSSFPSNTKPPTLPQGIEDLQQGQINPQQPGPAETMRSPVSSPSDVEKDGTVRHFWRTYKTRPFEQFDTQAEWELHKLKHQRHCMAAGRRQTQPWDDYFSIRGNAYNNVRNYWIEQGIWRKAWDEPWAKEGEFRILEPYPRFCKPDATRSRPGSIWGHEDGGPEPDAAREFGPDPYRTVTPWVKVKHVGSDILHPIMFVQEALEGPNYLIPYPTAPNSEASRPYRQFLYQTVKEREWVKDEMNFQIRHYDVDLDAMAYETVKYNWTESGLWNPEWKELPGGTWLHEDPIQEEDKVESCADGTQGSQVQDQPPKRHGEASEGGGKSKLGKRKSDGFDEKSPKRPRRNPRRSTHEASGPAGTDKESPAPKGVIIKLEQFHKGGNVEAVSNLNYRSPGIVKKEEQQTSEAGGVSTSGQTRSAKRGRPRRGDQQDKPESAKRQKKSGKHGRGKN
ncbi:hypothetical protein CEP53_008409 [Fusarium sp. AF-6]|nr:hypothetical protein CEP53_008409 [Fusarium sp. AF-6]